MSARSTLCAITVLAASVTPASAQDRASPAAAEAPPPDIVVTGRPLADTERALAACLKRHCPPTEDIAATLAHAENQFVAGDYKQARMTLSAALGRNKRFTKQYPVEVSNLYLANARIGSHLGEVDSYLNNEFGVVSALKSGLPDDDPRVLAAQIEIGDAYLVDNRRSSDDRVEEAARQYRRVERAAQHANQPIIMGYAIMRRAALYTQLADRFPKIYSGAAKEAIADLARETNRDPRLKPFGTAIGVLQLRLAAKGGDMDAAQKIVAAAQAMPATKSPVLIYAPAVDLQSLDSRDTGGYIVPRLRFDDQWVDVSFWIKPDGRVDDIGLIRSSEHFQPQGHWTDSVMKAIAGRRYAPLDVPAGSPGLLRVERYTLTSGWIRNSSGPAETRIPVRSGKPQIVMLDLSAPSAS